MSEVEFDIDDAGTACVTVRGEYDVVDKTPTRSVMRQALRSDAPAILLDLSECTYIDTTAMACLASAQATAEILGKEFRVIDKGLQLERLLAIAEIDADIQISNAR